MFEAYQSRVSPRVSPVCRLIVMVAHVEPFLPRPSHGKHTSEPSKRNDSPESLLQHSSKVIGPVTSTSSPGMHCPSE